MIGGLDVVYSGIHAKPSLFVITNNNVGLTRLQLTNIIFDIEHWSMCWYID